MNGMFNVCDILALVLQPNNVLRFIGVGEAEWAFKTSFNITEKEHASQNVDIVVDGLDTFASVKLVRIPGELECLVVNPC